MVRNGLVEDSQHGFVKGRSCETNLVEFFDYVSQLLDTGICADAIFLDFAKAFDKVPHNRLMEKIRALGINGEVANWIERWLAGRKQRLVLDGEASEWKEVVSGVPQGSVLGPVLFLIFIRDLDRALPASVRLRKFADDSKLANKIENEQDAQLLQGALDQLQQWADRWGMQFNHKKCKVMHFGRVNIQHAYTMGGQLLETTVSERDVGVMITNNLKSAENCAKAAKTAMTVLGQIKRSFRYRDKKIFTALYTRYVRPHLEFSSAAWSPYYQKDIDILEKVQKRAVSMVNGLNGLTYDEKLVALGLEPLLERRKFADLMLMFKVLNGYCTVNKELWASVIDRQNMVTRWAAGHLQLRKPLARTEKRSNYYTVRICDMWNELPNVVRAAKTVRQFKCAYRKYMQSTRRGPGNQ
jgi:hypothetical protein